jgi:digeranylgeranylglycerophospholipid reductase
MGSDIANVGIGVRSSYLGGIKLPQLLEKFVKEHPVAGPKLECGEVLAVMRGSVPADGMPDSIQIGNVLLAGDAAGHVMATSGGGIPLAMVAGKIAGEVAAGFIKSQTTLDSYSLRINHEFGRELERSVHIRRMVDVVMHSDRLMDALFGTLDPDQMKSIMRGQIPSAFSALHDLLGKTKN